MQVKSFLLTLGLGMVGGAVAATMLPKQPQVKQAVTKAADSIENAVESAKDSLVGSDSCSSSGCSMG
ncbi:MAG: hypothetical protein IKP19_02100 [Oscillospiraceae bacterium]|nr:hypothetical protein [Oscillospiraceae bacterium]